MKKSIIFTGLLLVSLFSFGQLPTLLKTEVLEKPNCVKYDSAKIKLTFSKGIDTAHTLCLNRMFDTVIYSANRDTATILNLKYDSATVNSSKGIGKQINSGYSLYAHGRLHDILNIHIDTSIGTCITSVPIDTVKIESGAGWTFGLPFYPKACGLNDTIDLDFLGVSPVLLTVRDTSFKEITYHKFSAIDLHNTCKYPNSASGACVSPLVKIVSGDGCPIHPSGNSVPTINPGLHVYVQPKVIKDTTFHTICKNDSIQFSNDKLPFSSSKMYFDKEYHSMGCDSLRFHHIKVIEPYDSATFDTIRICTGDTAFFADSSFSTVGITDTTVVAGKAICDSVIITKVIVRPTPITNITASSCIGQTYYFLGGDSATTSAIDTSILQNQHGCDSLIITALTMSYVAALDTAKHFICKGDSVLVGASYIRNSSLVPDTISGFCDTIRFHNIEVFNPFTKPTFKTAYFCPGDTLFFADSSFTTTNILDTTAILGTNACDSIIITNAVHYPVYSISFSDTICKGITYSFPDGDTSSFARIDTSILTSIYGCDSLVIVDLKVNPSSTTSIQANTCFGNWYKFPNGDSSNLSLIDTSRFTNQFGCDSIIVTTLSIDSVPYSISKPNICAGDWYVFPDGDSSNTSGRDTSIVQNSKGCDSVIYTILNVVYLDTTLTLQGDTFSIDTGYNSYQWYNCGTSSFIAINGATNSSYIANSTGSYAVTVQQYQCKDTSNCQAHVFIPIIKMGVPENIEKSKWSLFPNPVGQVLNIKPELNDATLKIYDVDGRIVQVLEHINGMEVSLSFPTGNYLIEIKEGEQIGWYRIIKE